MNKKERLNVLRKLRSQTWYAFCLLEASHESEITSSYVKLAAELGITEPTLRKYMTIWKDYGLIKMTPGGFIIAQLDGVESSLKEEIRPRKFNKALDVINYWCEIYMSHYNEQYVISNWGQALSNVKKLLAYTDEEIEGAIYCAITLYDTKWITPRYPRPTLGALCSWLFQQALPFMEKNKPEQIGEPQENLLDDLEAKGWI